MNSFTNPDQNMAETYPPASEEGYQQEEDEGLSDSTSLCSEFDEFVHKHNRSYHTYYDGIYPIPSDRAEQDRLNFQHHILSITFDSPLFLAPIQNVLSALDIGTGTGIWAMEFAELFPAADVRGIDLSPIQPEWVPPNCRFYVDNFEKPWPKQEYHFIHGRMLNGSITDLPKLVKQAFDHLKPGAYIEFQDAGLITCDDETMSGTSLQRWIDLISEGYKRRGRDLDLIWEYEKCLKDNGFDNVTKVQYSWPINEWATGKRFKELGFLTKLNMLMGLEGFSAQFLQGELEWTDMEMEVFLEAVGQNIEDQNIHGLIPLIVVFGQKPIVTAVAP